MHTMNRKWAHLKSEELEKEWRDALDARLRGATEMTQTEARQYRERVLDGLSTNQENVQYSTASFTTRRRRW